MASINVAQIEIFLNLASANANAKMAHDSISNQILKVA
jgi:hypothetical protein